MGKDIESLEKSRGQRKDIMQYLGIIPESIMLHDKLNTAIDTHANERSYESFGYKGPLEKAFQISGRSVRNGKALSRFSQNIGSVLLKLYTETYSIPRTLYP